MKITQINVYILRVPLGEQRFYSSQCAFPERNSLLVEVETDHGLAGWGEGGQYGPPEPVASCIRYVFAPLLLGKDPRKPGVYWEELYSLIRDFGPKGPYIEALSALDIALWDILGQTMGVPIHALLGGAFRDQVIPYATGCYYRGDDYLDHTLNLPHLVTEALSYVQQGFTILKVKVGLLSIEADVERLQAIRAAIGADVKILVDSNHAYNINNAIRMGRELEKLNVQWFEEPVLPEDYNGYQEVRRAVHVPIAGGECEYTRYGFRELLERKCVDIAQPDVCVCGGFSEFQKIQALASSLGVLTIPHVWGSGVALAAALHATASLPPMPHTANPVPLQNEPVIEYDRNHNPLRDDLLEKKVMLCDGKLSVPNGPGLGITLNRSVLQQYTAHQEICHAANHSA